MSDIEARQLERILKRDGGLDVFVLLALEDLSEQTLLQVREASTRILKDRVCKAKNVESVEELRDRIAEVPLRVTQRGFARFELCDRYGERCSIQESSLASEAAIWFGIDEPAVKVFAPAGTAVSVTLEYQNGAHGWADVKISLSGSDYADTLISGRMHLTQDRLRVLMPLLQSFVDTGQLVGAPDLEDELARMIRTLPDGQILRHGADCPYCNGAGFTEGDRAPHQCPVCLGEAEIDLTDPGFMDRHSDYTPEVPNA